MFIVELEGAFFVGYSIRLGWALTNLESVSALQPFVSQTLGRLRVLWLPFVETPEDSLQFLGLLVHSSRNLQGDRCRKASHLARCRAT